jgi:hypothetical protein
MGRLTAVNQKMYNLYNLYQYGEAPMKNVISISNARKDLPKMVREIQRHPETVFKIAVRSETVAELRAARPMALPGEAVRTLIQLRQEFSSAAKGKAKVTISKNVKKYLYTREKE